MNGWTFGSLQAELAFYKTKASSEQAGKYLEASNLRGCFAFGFRPIWSQFPFGFAGVSGHELVALTQAEKIVYRLE